MTFLYNRAGNVALHYAHSSRDLVLQLRGALDRDPNAFKIWRGDTDPNTDQRPALANLVGTVDLLSGTLDGGHFVGNLTELATALREIEHASEGWT